MREANVPRLPNEILEKIAVMAALDDLHHFGMHPHYKPHLFWHYYDTLKDAFLGHRMCGTWRGIYELYPNYSDP